MFDTIILMTGPTERPVLATALRGHRPALTVLTPASLGDLLAIDTGTLEKSRLIAFASPDIVPPTVLARLGYGAVNFHPGPPDFPGLSPAQFAVYHAARRFGATAHVMADAVDAGPIFDLALFEVAPRASVLDLETRSYVELARLFWRNAGRLAREAALPPALPVAWSGDKSSRRKYAALCAIAADIDPDDLDRRVRAFGGSDFGMRPTVTLHGHRFVYAPPEPPATQQPATAQPAATHTVPVASNATR